MVANNSDIAFTIDGSDNKELLLLRGRIYNFNLNTPGHPFFIKTSQVADATTDVFVDGITNNGGESGTLVFTVPQSAPSKLYYVCSLFGGMTAAINIIDGMFDDCSGVCVLVYA